MNKENQMNEWLEMMQKQWKLPDVNEQQKALQDYGMMMSKMSVKVSELMMKECMTRMSEGKPITNPREIYEIWLDCCHKVYGDAMHSKEWQETYGECMNAVVHYWKNVMGK